MSISSEISRISGNISASLTAVANKGVTVPSGSTSDDLPGLIAQIIGVSGITQDENGYIVISPESGNGSGITQDANGYIVLSSTGAGATQHTIHLEFTDETDTDILVYYDNSLVGSMITAYEPVTWTYNSKTVAVASLDNIDWYDKTSIRTA